MTINRGEVSCDGCRREGKSRKAYERTVLEGARKSNAQGGYTAILGESLRKPKMLVKKTQSKPAAPHNSEPEYAKVSETNDRAMENLQEYATI